MKAHIFHNALAKPLRWLGRHLRNPRALVPVSTRGRVISGCLAVLLLLGAASPSVIDRVFGLPDGAALRVGDMVVTETQFENRLELLGALYGIQQPEKAGKRDEFRRDVAKAIALSIVLEDAARERGIVVGEKSARDTLDQMISEQMGANGREEFVRLLGSKGASERDVLEEIRRQQEATRLFQDVVEKADIKVTDSMVRQYFARHREQMKVPERRHLRNVVVSTKEKAGDVADRARARGSLEGLVAKYSIDGSTRDKGGDLGAVVKTDLEERYADAAFGADPGSIFGPVRTKHGWNVGEVLDVEAERDLALKDVKDRIRETLRSEKALEVWRGWLSEQIKAADVDYADEYRPADPDAPPPGPSSPLLPGPTASTGKEQPK